jgi:hypothetical protein
MIETLDDVRAGTSAGTFDEQDCEKAAARRAGQGMTRPARVGDWLVEPGPPSTRMWRWGRITAVLPDGRHLVVRWYRDSHDTVVLPSPCARIEESDHAPRVAGDAVGLLPAV